MEVYYNISDFDKSSKSIVTIGVFDGVHLGHRQILSRLMQLKKGTNEKTVVFTFDPHPRSVLFPEQKDLKLISTTPEKLAILEKIGIDKVLVFPFSRDFSMISADKYIRDVLVSQLNTSKLVIGYDHRFGNNREGNIEMLIKYSEMLNFKVEEISAHDIDDINVSSSIIRKAIDNGDIKKANQYLGYTYSFEGIVVKGKQLGRTLGYPTANIAPNNPLKLIPKIGVYAVFIEMEDRVFKGMMSIGYNPTTDNDNTIKIEVNIFDFNQDIYYKKVKVNVTERLRNEEKFGNLEELKKQLEKDKVNSLKVLDQSI